MSTTIRLEPEVRDRLKRYGVKGETYNDILKRLMAAADAQALRAEARDAYLHPERHAFKPLDDL